jgi:hypothetical protein
VIVAHIGGVPVEEALLPVGTALVLSCRWFVARVRASHARRPAHRPGAVTSS